MTSPFPFPYGVSMFFHSVGKAKDMCENRLGNGVRAIGWDVGYGDPFFLTKGQVYHVISGCSDPDVSNVGKFCQDFAGDGCFVGDDDLGTGASFLDQFVRGALVYLQFAELGESVPREISGVEGVTVQDNNLHGIEDLKLGFLTGNSAM